MQNLRANKPCPGAFTLVELLVVIAIIGILVGLAMPAVQALRESARRMTCNQHLASISVALSEYQLSTGFYPAGTIDPKGPISNVPKGFHHNWVTALLPMMDHQLVYDKIDHSASIYAPSNAPIRTLVLSWVRCPSAPLMVPATTSNYAANYGSTETPIDTDTDGVMMLNRQLTPDDIPDGLDFTCLLLEKLGRPNRDLGWFSGTRATLRNGDHRFEDAYSINEPPAIPAGIDPDLFVGGPGSAHPNGVQLLMGSGGARFFSTSGDRKLLQQLTRRNDGNLVGLETAPDPTIDFRNQSSTGNATGDATGQKQSPDKPATKTEDDSQSQPESGN